MKMSETSSMAEYPHRRENISESFPTKERVPRQPRGGAEITSPSVHRSDIVYCLSYND